MTRWSLPRLFAMVGLCLLIWLAAAALCMMVSSSSTQLAWPNDAQVFSVRMDRVLISSLVGAALAAAGVAYQAVLRNPLADPYLLGASSGASLFAYVWQLPALAGTAATMTVLSSFSQQSFAFIGAIFAVGLVLIVAGRRGTLEPITLLLVGVIMNSINGSIFLTISEFRKDNRMALFLIGGIQDVTMTQLLSAAILAGLAWVVLLYASGWLNVAPLDESEAQALGVRIHRLRWLAMGMASLITASAVAISGPIGFVGLICPHLGRLLAGTDHRRLLPIATALGAVLLLVADSATRFLSNSTLLGTQLQVGIITSFLGGPFFLLLLIYRRREK